MKSENHEQDRPDPELLAQLDGYVAEIQAGMPPDRERVLRQYPHLSVLLDCLDRLEQCAASAQGGVPRDGAEEPTLLHTAAGGETATVASANLREFACYVLEEELGRGGMGVVYRAHQRGLGRSVAIKMIQSSQLASVEDVERFTTEARALASVRHPNIVAIHEAGEVAGQHFFAMDYLGGGSLTERIAAGPVEPEAAARCLATMARAVHHLHSEGIVHRDLKPGNILLDEKGCPYVTDFGLAKILSGESNVTRTGAITGTPSYMAPEQAAGKNAEVGPASDIYSLGVILYEMLVGAPPFRESNPLDTLVQVLEADPPPPRQLRPAVPRDLQWICLKCLEKNPRDRYASAEALADDIDRFLGHEVVDARPSGMRQTLERWARREPALVSRLGGIAIAITIIQARLFMPDLDLRLHVKVVLALAAWGIVSLLLQQLLKHPRWAAATRYAWALADAIVVTTTVVIVEAFAGPLMGVYPLLIAASGLWFQVPLVWFMTAVSLACYGILAALSWKELSYPHHHVLFLVFLAVIGYVVSYQVKRVRALSQYYEHRRLP